MTTRPPGLQAANPRRRPVHAGISEALIRRLVINFYDRVRADDRLGPIFQDAIGDSWDHHLRKMCAFWSSVMRMSGRYKGKPMLVHSRLVSVRPEHFEIWLGHFRRAAIDICGHEVAAVFIARAEAIAESLKLGMFFRPGGAGTTLSYQGDGAV